MDCNGVVNGFDLDGFILALGSTPPDYPEYYDVYPDCDVMNADVNGDGAVNGFDTGPFIGLMGTGNAGVARQRYEWDAENRLTKVEPTEPE
ncbi:hypothetical protein KJ815_06095, partial [bacterium]|nr:hypothetical protein [bacterium]